MWMSEARLALGVAAAVLTTSSCTTPADRRDSGDTGVRHAATPAVTVFSQLTDGHVIRISVRREAAITGRVRLGPSPSDPSFGRTIAHGPDNTLYALVKQAGDTPDKILILDAVSVSIRSAREVPPPTRYRSLALGPRSGRLYLFGDRPPGQDGAGAWLTVVNPDGTLRGTQQIRSGDDRDWRVYTGSVSPDERYAVVSYHGDDTTGADIVGLSEGRVVECRTRQRNAGCLADVHGRVLATREGVLAATGDSSLLAIGYDGKRKRLLQTHLTGNHLTEFGIDDNRKILYVVGSCGYTGGLSRVNIHSGEYRILISPAVPGTGSPPPAVCGEGVEVAPNGMLVVARLARPVPTESRPGKLLFVNTVDAKVTHEVTTAAEPLAYVVLG